MESNYRDGPMSRKRALPCGNKHLLRGQLSHIYSCPVSSFDIIGYNYIVYLLICTCYVMYTTYI